MSRMAGVLLLIRSFVLFFFLVSVFFVCVCLSVCENGFCTYEDQLYGYPRRTRDTFGLAICIPRSGPDPRRLYVVSLNYCAPRNLTQRSLT